ncbi:hypothetical protein FRC11_005922 [Ceratobasidium sp. 423]|nr:hypothetical protein FRC11_005922 [Ceratobasidium sp. 423]
MNAHLNTDRLIPYAKDHDRLQLALLYLEVKCKRHKEVGDRLKTLRKDEETIRKSFEKISKLREAKIKQYILEHHPANYIDSTGQLVFPDIESQMTQSKEEPGESHDQQAEIKHILMMEQSKGNDLNAVLESIKRFEDEQEMLDKCAAQKEAILKLIEVLHSTVFDGDTPAFPHEDQIEVYVQIARAALKVEQDKLDNPHQDDGLFELDEMAQLALDALNKVSGVVGGVCVRLDRERPWVPIIFLLKEFWKFKILDLCKTAAQRCQAWKEGIDNHFSEHPDTALPLCARTMIPQIDPYELVVICARVASGNSSAGDATHRITTLLRNANKARSEIRQVNTYTQLMKHQAATNVRKAKTILELRRRQLAAARTQILNHVVDPENCPLEQPAEELPDYPEQIAIHGLSESHPMVSYLLAESETRPVEIYAEYTARSQLNLIRRTAHPPVLLPSWYQPPTYNELDNPELLRRHYQRDVPPIEEDTPPEYSEEPEYRGMIHTGLRERTSIVQEELHKIVSTARQQLGLTPQVLHVQHNAMATFMGMLERLGIPVILLGPGVRF